MEFQYRAIDEHRSQSSPPPTAPSTPSSGSADSHGGAGGVPAERMGNSAVTFWHPDLPPAETAAVAAELRRQAQKERIRERILREEAEHLELELEVRRELREEMPRWSWPVLVRSVSGPDTPAVPSTGTITAANSSLPVTTREALSKANAATKRKSSDRATGALLVPSSKKQKSTLTCIVCRITVNSEKAMQDHLNGKVHKKKVVALPGLPLVREIEQERGLELGEEEAVAMETLGDYKQTKFMMRTDAGELNEVTQMDGYLLCELCNVRTTDRVTMMCHLQGSKHISNGKKKCQPSNKPLDEAEATVGVATSAIGSADPKKLVLESVPDTVAKVDAPLEKSLQPKLSDDIELQKMTLASVREDITTGDSAKTTGAEMMKSGATSAGAQLNNVCDSDSLTMELLDNVMHPLSRVDGFLVCLTCNVKAPSEIVMQSHLAGKMHKRKMILATRGKNDLAVPATGAHEMQDNNSNSTKANVDAGSVPSVAPNENTVADEEEPGSVLLLATPQTKNNVALASMAVDRPAEAQLNTSIVEPDEDCKVTEEAEGEHAAADSNGSVTQTKRTNDTTACGEPMKIQVEGKLFTVTLQENGSLSCEVCGIHGCDKDNMIRHLYTSTHCGKASLAEEK